MEGIKIENWAGRMLHLLKADESEDIKILFAKVKAVEPLSIEISGEAIEKYVYKIKGLERFEPVGDECKECDKVCKYKKEEIREGDLVMTVRYQDEFYIIGKVVI